MLTSPILKYLLGVLLTLTLLMQNALAAESPNSSGTPANKPLEKVTLQLKWLHQFQFAGYYAAKIKGFYADEGLDVDIRERDMFQNNIQQVIDGQVEYGVSDSVLLLYLARQEPVVIVAPIFQHSPQIIVTLKSSGIDSPYELQNRNIAFYQKDTDGFSLLAMLEQLKVKPRFERVLIKTDPKMLIRGEVDAYPCYLTNEPYLFREWGADINIIHPMNYGIDLYGDMLFTSKAEATNHPERVARFKRATIRGWEYALAHKKELANYIHNHLKASKSIEHLLFEADALEEMIGAKGTPIGTLSEGRLRFISDLFQKHQLIDKPFSLEEGIYRQSAQSIEFSASELAWIKRHPVVKVGVDAAWPPIEYADANQKLAGISAGFLDYISQKTGIRFEPATHLSWSETVSHMQTQQLDMYSAVANTPEKRDYTLFTQPYLRFPMVIATFRDEPFISDMRFLKGRTVAVVADYASHENLKTYYPEIPLLLVSTPQEGLEAVSKGQAYAYVDNVAVISHILKKENLTNLQISGETPFRSDIAMAVRQDWPELQSILQKVLLAMPEATKNRISNSWLQIAYKKEVEWQTLAFIVVPVVVIFIIILLYNRQLSRLNSNLLSAQQQLTESNAKLSKLSITDHLTGVYNRNFIDQTLSKESKRANRQETTLSVILIDLDNFKQVNDIYGHLAGDEVLIRTADWAHHHLRETDTFGRWGGEEFIAICPDTDLQQAIALAEKLREGIAQTAMPHGIQQTVSIGVAQYREGESIDQLISRTDQALYLAKHQGKNKVINCQQLQAS
ncbi:transporter substrate-binding domain-containing diguanylate cyclase [Thiomicrorhabdus cannonii]|uniref:transporter substrate-binding domain-containing diguanylate cyclase n=1 Tax=Thiomicrorhabdus cannonii TaxID=2748011 RepID=UPI0015C10EAB|nr:diguanylate cyclase [Thiomicrorhabdus cannonii]